MVFFERNGLRHGEFELREAAEGVRVGEWGYRVRELGWSADSNILSVWVERNESDIGMSHIIGKWYINTHDQCFAVQLWTMGNYHW